MPASFNLYVPSEYTFKHYFIPKTKNPALEWFEVDQHRNGVQRKGNNHLVVFLEFRLKLSLAQFTDRKVESAGEFHLKAAHDVKLFNKVFGHHKEVSVYSLSYHTRMSVLAWKLLIDIADDDKVLAVDDEGSFKAGPKLARELKELIEMA